jgi:DNA-binding transcriptional LysR family regulator
MDIDLRQLRAFVTVVDEGSFTEAATLLHLSQASVSRAVASLETALGAKVLRRTTREIGLTEVGARVLAPARRALEEADAVLDAGQTTNSATHIGHAWAALGAHTTSLQNRWSAEFPGSELLFVQLDSPASGLAEHVVDAAILRRQTSDPRLATTLVGVESRYAAMSANDPLARRRSVSLNDFADRIVAIDDQTGTTTLDLWPPGTAPSTTRLSKGMDDWLTMITAGQAVGITAEATTHQHPRPGLKFRPVRDAEPIPVWLAWRRDDPPPHVETLSQLICTAYGVG